MVTAFQVPDSLPGFAPLIASGFFAWALFAIVMEERAEGRKSWVRSQMRVTDVQLVDQYPDPDADTPGGSAWMPVGQVLTRDGRWVDAAATWAVGGTAARSIVGTTRDAWYLEEDPSQVRLLPPAGQGLLRKQWWKIAILLIAIVFGVYVTFFVG